MELIFIKTYLFWLKYYFIFKISTTVGIFFIFFILTQILTQNIDTLVLWSVQNR